MTDAISLTLRLTRCPKCGQLHLIAYKKLRNDVECGCGTNFLGAEFVIHFSPPETTSPYTTWRCRRCERNLLVPEFAIHFPALCVCGNPYPYQPNLPPGIPTQWRLHAAEDAVLGDDPMFLENQLIAYRAGQKYHYDFEKLEGSTYLVTNPTKQTKYRVTLDEIGRDSCECDVFGTSGGTCIHIEHLRLRLGMPSPALTFRDAGRGIYAWFDKSSFPARIRLGCFGNTLPVAQMAAQNVVTISDRETLKTVQDKVEQQGVPFWVFASAQRALVVPNGIESDLRVAKRISSVGRSFLAKAFPKLHLHQIEGALFLAITQRALLLDEMGLGKTLQAIAAAHLLHEFASMKSCLIVCPKSVMSHWSQELNDYSGTPSTIIEGSVRARRDLYRSPTLFKIVTIETLRSDFPEIGNPDLIIVDEVQKIRNASTKSNKVISSLNSRFIFGLSGAAIEAGLPDLYEILRAIRIPNLERPLEFFATHVICDDFGRPMRSLDSEIFFVRHSERILRRLKSEVASGLPDLHMTEVELPLTPLQESMSRPLLTELGEIDERLKVRFDSDDFVRSRWLINRLVELSDSSALIDPSTNESSKLTWLKEYLCRICIADSEKVVIFTRWTRCQDLITELCNEVGVGFTTLRGEDSAQKRKEAIEQFKCDDEVRVFISTDAGGTGVNLQFARHVVVFEPSWNPSMDAQRIQRVHRIGQRRTVEAVSPLTYLDQIIVQMTHGRKQFSADAIDAVRSPSREFNLPTWPELYPVIRHYHELGQQTVACLKSQKESVRKKK